MASTATAPGERRGARDVTEEANLRWLRFDNGVGGDWGTAGSEVVASGVKVGAEAEGAGCPRLRDRAVDEIFGGNYIQQGELPRRKRKAIAKRSKPQVDGIGVQNDMAQAQCPHVVVKENENLRLQLALKTDELKLEENRRLKLELILKTKEIESLQKQNEELKAENENLKKTAKPQRVERLCRFCQKRVLHDYRNCPERLRAARSSEEEEGEDSA